MARRAGCGVDAGGRRTLAPGADRPMGTCWPSLFEVHGRVFPLWGAFLARTRAPTAYRSKESLPRWAPVVFDGGLRRKANVRACYGVGLDVDAGRATRAALEDAFGDLHALVHTTWSSTPEASRWRVIVPTSRRITGGEYSRCHRYLCILAERAGIAVDLAARDPSRCWAVPAVRPGYIAFEIAGATFDVEEALRAIPDEKPLAPRSPSSIRSASAYVRAVLEREAHAVATAGPGVRNATLNRSAFAAARLVADGRLEVDDFEAAMLAAGHAAGLSQHECLATLRSALRGRGCG